jgi:tetratricopeptide (TPR) repeat protein
MEVIMEDVRLWEEDVIITTYEIGEADKNPIFLEKRVYQGSSGKIYPYPTIDTISDEKIDKQYRAVFLENKYIKVMILPELGGRIQRAYDKTNDYDFVYYNQVIKPALVGLTGPWISGGIEFNWPQHHRPTTFSPVDYKFTEQEDGSKTLLINDVDQMYGTKGITGFTLYPNKAYIEIRGQLYNRTPMPQTFLWWANPAVAVNDYTQSIFPPDVHAVMDHGKRDVSSFPIASGVYYKHDYSEGVDISRYKNIPVPTSYMAEKSEYDFVGGYDHNLRAGILHVADHHVSPGKKQWTWGCGDFGKAWDRNLTDEDGPYIELMTGVYTDNQPDFTWLKPFEDKSFKQYFMPYKAVGAVKNATIHAAVNLEKRKEGIYICVYATEPYHDATIRLFNKNIIVLEEKTNLSPTDIYEEVVSIEFEKETDLRIEVYDNTCLLVEYEPKEQKQEALPEPAKPAKDPEDINTNEELYLTGLHIEQYRHATYLPDPYYLEGLKRDEEDIRINNAYGALLMRRGLFEKAENYFRKALIRSTWKNPNPYNSEPYYNLGLSLLYQSKDKEAYDAFFKATWSSEQQEMSFYYLGAICAKEKRYEAALEFVEKGLVKNSHNIKARGLKAYLLRKLSKREQAFQFIQESLQIDSFDYVSMFELSQLEGDNNYQMVSARRQIMRDFEENYLQTARDYSEFGAYEEAEKMLSECSKDKPMLFYYRAYYFSKLGKEDKELLRKAENANPNLCFPNKLEDIAVLNHAIIANKAGAKAYYYLGNLNYDKLQYDTATALWEKSVELDHTYPTVLRNLSLAYFNKYHKPQEAKKVLEKAFALDTLDSRVFLELDQLYKRLGVDFEERLSHFETYKETMLLRDDLFLEYITLHNMLKRYDTAYELIMSRKFHPWEGGEGKVTTQYKLSLIELSKKAMEEKNFEMAKNYLQQALIYPENLGEGKLEGERDNDIYYYLGCVLEELGELDNAIECFKKAIIGTDEPAGMMYYNDQPADMILFQGLAYLKLGEENNAKDRFSRLICYGREHLEDNMRIEYFAVSLPDFLIFEDDLNIKNQAHCYYLIGLGKLGYGEWEEANQAFKKVLELDTNHINCRRFMNK